MLQRMRRSRLGSNLEPGRRIAGAFSLVSHAMRAIKTIVKPTFLGAFFLGFIGLCVGGVAALFIWPGSNLGPPVGALYGLFIGIFLGSVIGFVVGVVRLLKPRVVHENPEKTERAH